MSGLRNMLAAPTPQANPLMSGAPVGNPLLSSPAAAVPPPLPPQPQSVRQANGAPDHSVMRQRITGAMRNMDRDTLIKRRDTAGKEQAFLAQLMNDPNANKRQVERYIGSLVRINQFSPQEAVAVMRTLPRNDHPSEIRQWAGLMFAAVMNVGIHAHSAFPRGPEFPGQPAQEPQQPQAQSPQQQAPQDQDSDGGDDDADNSDAEQVA